MLLHGVDPSISLRATQDDRGATWYDREEAARTAGYIPSI